VQVADLNNDGTLDFVIAGAEPGNTTNFLRPSLGTAPVNSLKADHQSRAGNLKGNISLGFQGMGKWTGVSCNGGQEHKVPSHIVLIYFGDRTGNMTAGPIINVNEPHSVITRFQ
jgi:hypothetical protein